MMVLFGFIGFILFFTRPLADFSVRPSVACMARTLFRYLYGLWFLSHDDLHGLVAYPHHGHATIWQVGADGDPAPLTCRLRHRRSRSDGRWHLLPSAYRLRS